MRPLLFKENSNVQTVSCFVMLHITCFWILHCVPLYLLGCTPQSIDTCLSLYEIWTNIILLIKILNKCQISIHCLLFMGNSEKQMVLTLPVYPICAPSFELRVVNCTLVLQIVLVLLWVFCRVFDADISFYWFFFRILFSLMPHRLTTIFNVWSINKCSTHIFI